MANTILKILAVFLLGVLGGVWSQTSLLPYLAETPFFQNLISLDYLGERQVTVNPTQTITVQENTVLTQVAGRVDKTVVGVRTKTVDGEILEGSGLVVTSDGLIVTLADLVPQGSDFYFYVDGQWPSYQILKRDLENNLALVKLGEGGLSTTGFADLNKTRLGERVLLLEMEFEEMDGAATGTEKLLPIPYIAANEGIISFISENAVKTNIQDSMAAGSPLFNIAGDIVGLNQVDESGRISAIPISVVRSFVGF